MSLAIKIAMSIGTRLLTEAALEELILYLLKKLSQSTKTKIDDEIYQLVEKHLNK